MLKKKIEESMRLEIANIKMNEGLCLALGAVANVNFYFIIIYYRTFSLTISKPSF